jgi:hypothetical protein
MRVQGWEKRLADYFELQKDRPFVWGENDCILFSANAVSLLLDRDIIGEISEYGTYDRELALEILSRHGGQISGILDKHFKRKPNVLKAKRGDIALVELDGTEYTGIVYGHSVICKTTTGLKHISVNNISVLWEVE